MKQIQIIDPNTSEVANYLETNVWHDGTPMNSEKCDGVLYREIECGEFYKRQVYGAVKMSWYKHLITNTDASEVINSAIDCLSPDAVIDGEYEFFNVHSIWLKSNIVFKNFNLKSISTDQPDVSVLCIGNDFNPQNNPNPFLATKYAERVYNKSATSGESNIIIENVTIDGNRKNHSTFGPEARNGGKQGICIKGKVSKIKIRQCEISYCGTDGLQIYSGLLHTTNDNNFAASDIEIDNLSCHHNRRHGASGDSIENLIVRNSKFNFNGQDIDNTSEGNQGDTFHGYKYGNGWDMEGYGIGSNIANINFTNCQFFENVRAGLLVYENLSGDEPGFVIRKNIFLSGCDFDCGTGVDNPDFTFTAVDITGPQSKIQSGNYLYNNIVFDNCNFMGRILGKSIERIIIRNCQQLFHPLDIPENRPSHRGIFQNIKSAVLRNTQTSKYLWTGEGFEILSDDIMTKSFNVDLGTIPAGALHSFDTEFAEAEYGDIVTVTLDTLNQGIFKEFSISGLVPFPGDKILVTVKNNSSTSQTIPFGKLKIIVEKKLIVK